MSERRPKYYDGPPGVYYNHILNEILILEYKCEVWNIPNKHTNESVYYIWRADDNGRNAKRLNNGCFDYSHGYAMTRLGEL